MPPTMHGANALAFADYDGDGDADLFWGDFFEAGVLLIENIGRTCSTPSFQVEPVLLPLDGDQDERLQRAGARRSRRRRGSRFPDGRPRWRLQSHRDGGRQFLLLGAGGEGPVRAQDEAVSRRTGSRERHRAGARRPRRRRRSRPRRRQQDRSGGGGFWPARVLHERRDEDRAGVPLDDVAADGRRVPPGAGLRRSGRGRRRRHAARHLEQGRALLPESGHGEGGALGPGRGRDHQAAAREPGGAGPRRHRRRWRSGPVHRPGQRRDRVLSQRRNARRRRSSCS